MPGLDRPSQVMGFEMRNLVVVGRQVFPSDKARLGGQMKVPEGLFRSDETWEDLSTSARYPLTGSLGGRVFGKHQVAGPGCWKGTIKLSKGQNDPDSRKDGA